MPKIVQAAEPLPAPDQRGEPPAQDATRLRLALASAALAHILDMSVAVEKTTQAAHRMVADGDSDDASGLFECAAVTQSLMSYMAARAGDAVRGVAAGDLAAVGDTASWVMPHALDRLLWQIERAGAQ